jgi:hypothetical protein
MTGAAKIDRSPSADRCTSPDNRTTPNFAERHYTVKEIASLLNLSDDAVRKIFEEEPGVLVLGNATPGRGKRRYRTLRIPEKIVERVHRRLTKGVDCAPC